MSNKCKFTKKISQKVQGICSLRGLHNQQCCHSCRANQSVNVSFVKGRGQYYDCHNSQSQLLLYDFVILPCKTLWHETLALHLLCARKSVFSILITRSFIAKAYCCAYELFYKAVQSPNYIRRSLNSFQKFCNFLMVTK